MERPNARGSNNFVVGLFVFVALLVGAGFVVFMGGSTSFGGETRFKTIFADVRGLNVGAPVYLQGIQIGRVSNFEFPDAEAEKLIDGGHGIVSVMSIYKEHAPRVKADAMAEITTQGVLGDKVVVLTPGAPGSPSAEVSSYLKSVPQKELSEYFSKGGNLVENLNQAATNLNAILKDLNQSGKLGQVISNLDTMTRSLAETSQHIAQSKGALGKMINGGEQDDLGPALASLRKILDKINKGQGTLGALVNDSTLHEDMKILLGGAKRSQTVRFILRQAISAGDEENSAPTKK